MICVRCVRKSMNLQKGFAFFVGWPGHTWAHMGPSEPIWAIMGPWTIPVNRDDMGFYRPLSSRLKSVSVGSEHERYLTEKIFKKPTIVYDYPKDIKVLVFVWKPSIRCSRFHVLLYSYQT